MRVLHLQSKRFLYYVLTLSLAGGLIAWFSTSQLGAGLGTDSANYLAAAQNLADDKGLLMYNGLPMVHWAPGYPVLLAGLHLLLGVDVFVIGWLLNIVLFAVAIFLSGLLFKRVFGEASLFACAGPLLLLTSVPILSAVANISSDPLFLVLVLLFLLQAQAYLQNPTRRNLYLLIALIELGIFVRYAGVSLVAAGSLLVLVTSQGSTWRRLLRAGLFGLLVMLPMLAWGVHNYALSGRFFGSHRFTVFKSIQNLSLIPEKVVAWFVPESILKLLPSVHLAEFNVSVRALWVMLAFAGVLLALSNRVAIKQFLSRLKLPAVLPSLALLVSYSLVLVLTSSYPELSHVGFDRIHVILLPSLLCLVFLAVRELPVKLKQALSPHTWRAVLLLACLALLSFTGYRTYKYALATSQQGDVNYNYVNSAELRNSDLTAFLDQLSWQEGERVYSNNQAVSWFYLRRQIDRVPSVGAEQGWPLQGHGYIVWLKGDYHYLPGLISDFSQEDWLQLIFSDDFGDVYRFDR